MTIATSIRSPLRYLGRLMNSKQARRHAAVGPAHQWEMKRKFQIEFLKARGLETGHRLVDIGCGTLRGGIPLIEYLEPGHYTGLEVRSDVLDDGRAELREAGLESKQPHLICNDDFDKLALDPPDTRFDYAWAFAVLIHMPDDVLESCLSFVGRHLASDGALYANINVCDPGDAREGKFTQWQGFPVMAHPLDWYRATAARHGLKIDDLASLLELGHDDGKPHADQRRMLRWSLADDSQTP